MLLFTNNAFVPCTVLTCDVTVHALEEKKKQKKKKTVYTNIGLETQIQPALKYGSGKWDHGS